MSVSCLDVGMLTIRDAHPFDLAAERVEMLCKHALQSASESGLLPFEALIYKDRKQTRKEDGVRKGSEASVVCGSILSCFQIVLIRVERARLRIACLTHGAPFCTAE